MQMRLPDGIYIIGDAACAFNPVYGQGMTVAAQGAFALYELLNERLSSQADVTAKRQSLAGLNKVGPRSLLASFSQNRTVPSLLAGVQYHTVPSLAEGGVCYSGFPGEAECCAGRSMGVVDWRRPKVCAESPPHCPTLEYAITCIDC